MAFCQAATASSGSLGLQGVAKVVVGIGVLWLEFDGFTQGQDRVHELLLVAQGQAEVVVPPRNRVGAPMALR